MEEVPKRHASHAPLTVQIMFASLAVDDMRRQRTDIAELTMFCAHQITIAHQRNGRTIDLRDAMHNIMIAIGPSQNHMTHLKVDGFLKDDTLLAANDERQHALSVDGQRDADALANQTAGFFNNHTIVHKAIVL